MLADELRSTVLREALGIDDILPEDFEWDMLTYPTPNSEKSTQIKNLEQLKKANAAELLETEQKDEGISEEDLVSNDDAMNNFSIGVWDPSLVGDFVPQPKISTFEGDEKDEALAESIGMGNPSLLSSNISDDEEEDEEEMFFDFKTYKSRFYTTQMKLN